MPRTASPTDRSFRVSASAGVKFVDGVGHHATISKSHGGFKNMRGAIPFMAMLPALPVRADSGVPASGNADESLAPSSINRHCEFRTGLRPTSLDETDGLWRRNGRSASCVRWIASLGALTWGSLAMTESEGLSDESRRSLH